jgi:hypothetical protein
MQSPCRDVSALWTAERPRCRTVVAVDANFSRRSSCHLALVGMTGRERGKLRDRQSQIVERPPQHDNTPASQQHGALPYLLPRVGATSAMGSSVNLCCIRDAAGPCNVLSRHTSRCSILHRTPPPADWLHAISPAQPFVDVIGKWTMAPTLRRGLGPSPHLFKAGRDESPWAN